jgi:hypothetical protein
MFRNSWIFILTASAVLGQEPRKKEARTFEYRVEAGAAAVAGGPVVHFMAAGPAAGKAVAGAPYSAEAVTDHVRTLSDGTRITRRTTAKFARDSEGRTRDEQHLPGIGPWSSSEGFKLISIFDPVVREMYLLNEREKTAERIKLGVGAPGTRVAISRREVRTDRRIEVTQSVSSPPQGEAGTIAFQASPAADHIVRRRGDAKSEQLGMQIMEGLQVQGTRITRTVPPGEIGNDRPLISTEERWESTELKTLVRSISHDPEFGDSTYRLTNISRSEPPKSLFQIPAGYKVDDGPAALEILGKDPDRR